MKQLSARFLLFTGLAFVVSAMTGCQTVHETERPQMCTVVAVMGDVKYWDSHSNKVHTVKPGKQIPPGSTIQTAKGAGNWVDLAMGARLPDVYSSYPQRLLYPPRYDPADSVRIYENSILTLSKVTLKKVGENPIPDTRLQLFQGAVLYSMGSTSPAQVSKGEIGAPYHEIKGSNVIVRAKHGIFFLGASGLTRVIDGTARLERTDQGTTKELSAWQEYDPVTGAIRPITDALKIDIINSISKGDYFAPAAAPVPRFPVSRRPF